MSLNAYKHSHFAADAFGHGGNKRTAQIDYLLRRSGIDAKQADFTNSIPAGNKLSFYIAGLQKNATLSVGSKSKYAAGRYKAIFEQFVRKHKPDLFIWESVGAYNLLLAEVFYKHNIPVIALPHNLESLVLGTKSVFSNRQSPHWLFEELDYLKLCEKVFTISIEEYWLLSNYGINTSYLPYYPVPAAESYLLDIRQKRTASYSFKKGAQNILLLGTFHNGPTFTGFIELLQHIKIIKGINIHIAGFGSEKLTGMFQEDHLRVWGSVNNDTLADLIIKADCVVIQQPPTSGALTRIPELLIADVPIIANTHAARSYNNTPGLKIYASYDELIQILLRGDYIDPPLMNRPGEEDIFCNYIKGKAL